MPKNLDPKVVRQAADAIADHLHPNKCLAAASLGHAVGLGVHKVELALTLLLEEGVVVVVEGELRRYKLATAREAKDYLFPRAGFGANQWRPWHKFE